MSNARSVLLSTALVSVLLFAGCAAERASIVSPIISSDCITTFATEQGAVQIGLPTFTQEGFKAIVVDGGIDKEIEIRCNGRSVLTRITRPSGFYESEVVPRLRSVAIFVRTETDSLCVVTSMKPSGESAGVDICCFNGVRMNLDAFVELVNKSTIANNTDALLLKAILESPDIEEWAASNQPAGDPAKGINWKRVGAGVCATATVASQVCRYVVAFTPCWVVNATAGACFAVTAARAFGWL